MFEKRIVLGLLLLLAVTSVARSEDTAAQLSAQLLKQIEAANADLKQRCSHSILEDNLPPELDCGNGRKAIGDQWNFSMTRAGIPVGFEKRTELAKKIGLDPSLSLVFVGGMARGEAVSALLDALKRKSS